MTKLKVVESSDAPKERTPAEWASFWQKELAAAQKRQATFLRQGNGVVARYRNVRENGEDALIDGARAPTLNSLNLFWSNITTLQSMLYGQTPKIDVSREHHDPDDDIARVACVLFQRILQADVEASGEDFATALKSALQDRLLPGLGNCRATYELKTSKTTPEGTQVPVEQVDHENAAADYVHWQDMTWGWARTWSEIPWLGFRSYLSKSEAAKRFGAKIADQLEYINQLPTGDNGDSDAGTATDSDLRNNVQKAEIWEFWRKKDKRVYYYSKGVDLILDSVPDPLQLTGFWPIPRPMTANLTTSLFMPKADFCMAQDLYNEIDLLQTRISNITRAVKVVGVYDKACDASVGRMLQEGSENDLIPVDSWAMFAEKGGLKGSIDWFPVKDVVDTLNTLIQIRDQTIGLLHEVTGMSDILRGANTDQYTSDGTNQLKAKFGSIRVQCLQDDFARFASDLAAMKAEIISKHYQPASIFKQSNAQYIGEADKHLVEPAIALMKSPDVKWRINIRPESIAMIDYAQLKSERTEYLTAMATFIQSANSMVSAVPQALPLMLEFMKFGMVGFKGSDYLEGILDQAIDMAKKAPPPGQDDGKAQAEMQLEQMRLQGEQAKIAQKHQATMEELALKQQNEVQKLMLDNANTMREIAAASKADIDKIVSDLRADLQVIGAKRAADLDVEEAQSTYAIAEEQTQHADVMQQLGAEHSNALSQIKAQGAQQAEPDSDD